MTGDLHSAAAAHLPPFITSPGQSDWLYNATVVFVIVMIMVVGNLYLRLHSLPERMAHRSKKLQFEIVAILGLISLFTHNHIFWIAGLLLAFIEFPDFSTPLTSMARSLGRLARRGGDKYPPKRSLQPTDETEGRGREFERRAPKRVGGGHA